MKVLVTGGNGFLGSYIVRDLLKRGDTVKIFSRRKPSSDMVSDASHIGGDIRDYEKLNHAASAVDAIIHLASKVGIWGDYDEYYDINVNGSKNVIRAALSNNIRKLVYTSTPSVIFDGHPHAGIDETRGYPSRFYSSYQKSKAIAEKLILDANSDKLATVAIRPHLIWGPNDTNLIPRLIKKGSSGRLAIIGDGKNVCSFSYVENSSYGHLLALDKLDIGSKLAGEAIFLADEPALSLYDFMNEILIRYDIKPATKKVPFKLAYFIGWLIELLYTVFKIKSEPPMTRFLAMQLGYDHWFKIDKAKKLLGYKSLIDKDEGLKRTIDSGENRK